MSTVLHIEIQDTHVDLFRKSIEYLLANTFLLKSREETLYKYLSNVSNLTNVNKYLELLGYVVHINTQTEIAMLQTVDKGDDDPKRYTTLQLRAHYSRVLIILAKLYYEKYISGDDVIRVTIRELSDQIAAYKITGPTSEKNWLENALGLFKKYNLIDFDSKDETENKVITLNDSIRLLLGGHIEQFKANVDKYINIFGSNDDLLEENIEEPDDTTVSDDYDEL